MNSLLGACVPGDLARRAVRRNTISILIAACVEIAAMAMPCAGNVAHADADDFCAKIRNDDRLRPYDPALRPGFVRAFRKLFPDAKGGQSDSRLRAEAVFRCMDGKLLACFKGANLPCAKIGRMRENAGAEAFCRVHPEERDVPLAASGHESEFTFRCRGGHAEVAGTAWVLDDRGFAKDLWAPFDSD